MDQRISFQTDTAELVLFDPTLLLHRLNDAADWWTVESNMLIEQNLANAMFVDLGTDGQYGLRLSLRQPDEGSASVTSILKCESGRLFVGPGEETTSGGCEPDPTLGGEFVQR